MGCCPTTWWCTADGPVGVEADSEGVYTPPDDATGGPYGTEEEALDACPPAPWRLVCGEGEFALLVPKTVVVNLVDKTGPMATLFSVNSIVITIPDPLGGSAIGSALFPDANGKHWVATFTAGCSGVNTWTVTVAISCIIGNEGPGTPGSCDTYGTPDCIPVGDTWTGASPWVDGFCSVYKVVTLTADTWAFDDPEEAASSAHFLSSCLPDPGSMKVVLSR